MLGERRVGGRANDEEQDREAHLYQRGLPRSAASGRYWTRNVPPSEPIGCVASIATCQTGDARATVSRCEGVDPRLSYAIRGHDDHSTVEDNDGDNRCNRSNAHVHTEHGTQGTRASSAISAAHPREEVRVRPGHVR